jgi:hypothetical protein
VIGDISYLKWKNMKIDYELNARKNKAKGELGYGLMWLFLAVLMEVLFYFERLDKSYLHVVALIFIMPAVFKIVVGIKRYKRLKVGEF